MSKVSFEENFRHSAANDEGPGHETPEQAEMRRHVYFTLCNVLSGFKEQGIPHHLIRDYWADELLRTLLKANPYRNPVDTVGVRQDIAFLYFLQDRIERISEQLCKAMDRHYRTISEDAGEV